MKIGFAKDIHLLKKNAVLKLGGVTIPSKFGLVSNTDGDVVLHSVSEALLGALALGDLGQHFPDNDDSCKNMSSSDIAKKVSGLVKLKGYSISNIDVSIELEQIKLKDYIFQIRLSIAGLFEIDMENISVKAMTNEGMDATGKAKACIAYAVVLVEK
ncbi:MAG: 2-C-methyl-D-erythritol 2,4-cyclodiphosphate synthase [Bacilli bacterium]